MDLGPQIIYTGLGSGHTGHFLKVPSPDGKVLIPIVPNKILNQGWNKGQENTPVGTMSPSPTTGGRPGMGGVTPDPPDQDIAGSSLFLRYIFGLLNSFSLKLTEDCGLCLDPRSPCYTRVDLLANFGTGARDIKKSTPHDCSKEAQITLRNT